MRDIDFLPAWYPQIQKRYRWLLVQAWVSAAIILMLGGYALVKRLQVHNGIVSTAQCKVQIRQSQQQVAQLNAKMKFESELREQDQIVARLGLGVDTTRLLKSLEDAMTPEMGLTNVSLETLEQPRETLAVLLPGRRPTAESDPMLDMDRRLKVVVDGVAPTDTESATFLASLLKVNCFDNVNLEYMRPGASQNGHVTREFEVTFDLNLNPPTEGKP